MVLIDAASTPPESLSIRGRAALTDVQGIVPEYALAHRRYAEEQGAANIAAVDHPGTTMVRIAVRPAWVGCSTSSAAFRTEGRRTSSSGSSAARTADLEPGPVHDDRDIPPTDPTSSRNSARSSRTPLPPFIQSSTASASSATTAPAFPSAFGSPRGNCLDPEPGGASRPGARALACTRHLRTCGDNQRAARTRTAILVPGTRLIAQRPITGDAGRPASRRLDKRRRTTSERSSRARMLLKRI